MIETIKKLALPTKSQIEWADAEIGVIIHFDMQVFEPDYNFRKQWGYTPDAAKFNPIELNTDQWIETAKAAGATYAVLVAKHCSGFSLWPTKAHSYSVASSPWRNGQGDIVADFIRSCEKYGLRPGIYASASCNACLRVDNPGKVLVDDPVFLKQYSASIEMQGRVGQPGGGIWAGPDAQKKYNAVVETQLTELWSNYGKLFEIWFDGGVLPPEEGGPDIVPILQRLQPDAVVFGGPKDWPSLARFVGNERGDAPDPFWSSTFNLDAFDGTAEVAGLGGSPDGAVWAGGEADMPNRDQKKAFQGGWFWRNDDDQFLYSLDHLTECYFTSVARNTNLLLGMVIDPRGLVPEADRRRFAEFGQQINDIFSNPLAKTNSEGASIMLDLPEAKKANMLMIMEDIAYGQRIRKFAVEACLNGEWKTVWNGSSVGHKRIERFTPLAASQLRLTIEESVGTPKISEFSAWQTDENLFSVPFSLPQRSSLFISRDKNGFVSIQSSNPNLAIKYTVDGYEPDKASPIYEKPFPLRDGGTVKAFSFANLERSATATAVFGCDRSSWRVVSVSLESPFKNDGFAGSEHLLDDDPTTYWHTYHADKTKSAAPHEAVLDMGKTMEVAAFTLMPRICGPDGAPDQYEFHLSSDGKNWTPAAKGEFLYMKSKPGMRLVQLDQPMPGRFIRFVAVHTVDNDNYVAVAGIGAVCH